MKVDELQMDVEYTIRLGRYVEGLDHPKWGEWHKAKLHLQRAPKDYRPKSFNGVKKGELTSIAVASGPLAGSWAEYGKHSYSEQYKVFEAGGYYMQIQELLS